MVLVWFLGCLYADGIIYWVEEVLPNLWFNFLWLVPISISVLLIVYAKMAKKYDKKWMYWSAFVVAILPLSMFLLEVCSNDSNIFSYLFAIILMPLILLWQLCYEYFEIIFYEIADGFLGFFMCPALMLILTVSIIVSLVVFLKKEPGDGEQAMDNEVSETDK